MKYKYWSIALLFFCSCQVEQKQEIPHFSFGNTASEPLDTPPEFEYVEIVPLETSTESLLRFIETIEVYDSLIFVKDIDALYLYKRNGNFITQIGSRGQGPDEYVGISAFYIDKQARQVVLIDEMKQALLKFDFAGKHVASVHLPLNAIKSAQQAMLYDDSTLMINHYINFEANMAYTLLSGENYSSHFSYDPITVKNYMYSLSKHQMTKCGNSIDFIMPLCDTIFSFSDHHFEAKYVIDLPHKLPPRKQFKTDTENSYSTILRKYTSDGFFPGFTAIYETEKNILLQYKDQGFVLGYYMGDKDTFDGNYYLNVTYESIEEMPFFPVTSAFDNVFVGVAEAQALIDLNNNISANTKDASLSHLKNIIGSLQDDSNPVLFFYHLK